jgi:hypothetical protein
MSEEKKNAERIDIMPEVEFDPDNEWTAEVRLAIELVGGATGNHIAQVNSAIREDTLVEDVTAENTGTALEKVHETVRELRSNEMVQSVSVDWVLTPGVPSEVLTVEGAFPIKNGSLAPLLFADHVIRVLRGRDEVESVEPLGYALGSQRERTIGEMLSIDFGTKKFVEHEDGHTERIEE